VLLNVDEQLTPADHHTHRRYTFTVPPRATRLDIHLRYAPKALPEDESMHLATRALWSQAAALAPCVGQPEADAWAVAQRQRRWSRVRNLLTVSVDDADGVYRGACHRQPHEQHMTIERTEATPGLVPGGLMPGEWRLTLSAHTLASAQCAVEIQIAAETASRRP